MRFIMASACKIGYGFSKSARGSLAPSQTASVTALLILSGPCQNVLSVGLGGRAERNACLRRGFIWYFFSCYFRRVIYTGIYTGGGTLARIISNTGVHWYPLLSPLGLFVFSRICLLIFLFSFAFFLFGETAPFILFIWSVLRLCSQNVFVVPSCSSVLAPGTYYTV